MAIYNSDGKKLVNVEYDVVPEVGDMIDGMRVVSVTQRGEELAVFLLEPNTKVTCYIFDEVFIIGKAPTYDTLIDAIEAWNSDEF